MRTNDQNFIDVCGENTHEANQSTLTTMQIKRPYPFYGSHYLHPQDEYEIMEFVNSLDSHEDEQSPDFYLSQSKYDEIFFFTDVEGVVLYGNSIYYKCDNTRIVSYVRDMLRGKKVIVFIAQNGKGFYMISMVFINQCL